MPKMIITQVDKREHKESVDNQ